MDRSNPSKIKAVILDYGEVLCYAPTAEEMGRMAAPFGMAPVPFRQLWDRDRLRYDRGDLSPEEYWSALAKSAGAQLTPEQFAQLRPMGSRDVEPRQSDHGGVAEAHAFVRNKDRDCFPICRTTWFVMCGRRSPGWTSSTIRPSRPRWASSSPIPRSTSTVCAGLGWRRLKRFL